MGVLRRLAGLDYADDAALPAGQRAHLRDTYLNGLFSSVADGATGSYHNLFLLAMNASAAQIGLLATLSQALSAIAPLPGAWIAERTRAYKLTILIPALVWRLGFLPLALLPVFFHDQTAVLIAIAFFVARIILMSATGPPWMALMGQLVPARIRAQYFSARNFIGGLAVVIGTLAVGLVINALGFPLGYQVVFVLMTVLGLMATYFFARVPSRAYGNLDRGEMPKVGRSERASERASERTHWRATLASYLRYGDFVRFTLCAGVMNFSVMIAGPYIQLYQVRELGFTAAVVGVLASVELTVNIVMQRVYGAALIPRFGDYRVMTATRMATALVPLAWMFVRDPLVGALVSIIPGLVWSGHDLAYFNALLAVTPEDRRAHFIAVNTVAVALFGALGPVLAALLVDVIGYQALFGLSGVLRFLSGVMLVYLMKDWAGKRVN